MAKTSAGLVLFRQGDGDIEVFLVHPGGPFWTKNTFTFKGREFPEVDRAAWFSLAVARQTILEGQRGFLEQLEGFTTPK